MKKLTKIGYLFFGMVFILTLFSNIRIMALYCYHLQQAKGSYDLAMRYMDKANIFDFTSYVSGWLHSGIIVIMWKIIRSK